MNFWELCVFKFVSGDFFCDDRFAVFELFSGRICKFCVSLFDTQFKKIYLNFHLN